MGAGGEGKGSPFSRARAWMGVWEQTVPLGNILTSPPQPSASLRAITEEDVKMGDPEETLRRASMEPSQLLAAPTQASTVTTRQRRKRLSETPQDLDTPPVSSAQSPITAPYWEQQASQVLRELLWPCG